jgi:hypothetical protein
MANSSKEELKRFRGKVLAYENDGQYVRLEFNRDNGERVIAEYELVGWSRPPAVLAAELDRRLNMPPVTVVSSRRRR